MKKVELKWWAARDDDGIGDTSLHELEPTLRERTKFWESKGEIAQIPHTCGLRPGECKRVLVTISDVDAQGGE